VEPSHLYFLDLVIKFSLKFVLFEPILTFIQHINFEVTTN
jgi:hypothetical protein